MRTMKLASSALVALLVAASPGRADESFDVRLAPAPRDASMKNVIAGHGTAHVMLAGRTLTISGTFEGFATPATRAELHRGVAVAVRGPAIRALTVSTATEGTLAAEITLTEEELGALNAGQLYVEIASQSAPEGNVLGWLLPASAPVVRDR
jgi:CHRD domain